MYCEKWFNLDSAEYVETGLHIWTLYYSLKKLKFKFYPETQLFDVNILSSDNLI